MNSRELTQQVRQRVQLLDSLQTISISHKDFRSLRQIFYKESLEL